jgi:hypothetical protein
VLREEGIATAINNAENQSPGWSEQAFNFLIEHAPAEFTVETIRLVAESRGIPLPPHKRAWGGIIKRAHREKRVTPTPMYVSATEPNSHCAPKRVWRRVNDHA